MQLSTSFVFLLLLAGAVLQAQNQEETLMSGNSDAGAFGAVFIEGSSVNGHFGADVGGGGALIYNGFFLGGYGQGAQFAEHTDQETRYDIQYNHGGLWLGYTPLRKKLVHPYVSTKIGWGKVRLKPQQEGIQQLSENHFTLLPEAGVELNINGSLRVVLSAGYRIVNGLTDSDVAQRGITNKEINGATGKITFRIGEF